MHKSVIAVTVTAIEKTSLINLYRHNRQKKKKYCLYVFVVVVFFFISTQPTCNTDVTERQTKTTSWKYFVTVQWCTVSVKKKFAFALYMMWWYRVDVMYVWGKEGGFAAVDKLWVWVSTSKGLLRVLPGDREMTIERRSPKQIFFSISFLSCLSLFLSSRHNTHNWPLKPFSQGYWPSFSHHLCWVC